MAWSGSSFSETSKRGPTKMKTMNRTIPSYQSGATSSITMLDHLQVGSTATVLGVIIAKESPRSIFSRKNQGSERFLLNFTLRDSPSGFVNVTCWGQESYIKGLAKAFTIGDCVTLSNVIVQPNPTDGSDEKFKVSTPLPYHISISENHSTVIPYSGPLLAQYTSLLSIPTKATTDYYTLEDVLANGQSLNREHINLLTVVKRVGPVKEITTKAGRHTKRCEVKLFDESCPSFPLVLWGEELVDIAQSWIPMETVLFVADVRMNFDDYRSAMVATADSKTVFTLNPECVDANCLYQFAQTQTFNCDEDMEGGFQVDPPLEQITTVVTVEDLLQGSPPDYAILFGVLTKFDLDSETPERFIKHRCSNCHKIVTSDNGYQCLNQDCSQGVLQLFNQSGEITGAEPEQDFSLPIDISDHSGTIHTRLTELILSNLTGWNVKDLLNLDIKKRTDLKWNYLLERCKFYIKMQKFFHEPGRLIVRVISCSRADPAELLQIINQGCKN